MVTIVMSHPWHGSFNKAIVDKLVIKYNEENKECQVIDLHKDEFNPAYTEKELSQYNTGYTNDPLIIKYQEMIRNTTELILVFPIWWGTMPAMLKGFFDRVMLLDFAFNYNNDWTTLLNIDKGVIISTSQSPTEWFKTSIEDCVIPQMMHSIGVKNVDWYNCDNVSKSERSEKTAFLEKLVKEI